MDGNMFVDLVSNLGFPVVVTGYLLMRMDRLIVTLITKVGELTDAVKDIKR